MISARRGPPPAAPPARRTPDLMTTLELGEIEAGRSSSRREPAAVKDELDVVLYAAERALELRAQQGADRRRAARGWLMVAVLAAGVLLLGVAVILLVVAAISGDIPPEDLLRLRIGLPWSPVDALQLRDPPH